MVNRVISWSETGKQFLNDSDDTDAQPSSYAYVFRIILHIIFFR